MDNPQDDLQSLPEAKIIEPTPQEIEEGLARLNKCLPSWLETPAMLIVKPDLALIVSVVRAEYDDMGFLLHLAVRETLAAPADYHRTETRVSCVWNQPYMGFAESYISAPYSFYLHFGAEGVARARECAKSIHAQGLAHELYFPLGLLRACFRD